MRKEVVLFDLGDEYYQAVWYYERRGEQVIHTFRMRLHVNTLHTVEILMNHGYSVTPHEILEKMQTEARNR